MLLVQIPPRAIHKDSTLCLQLLLKPDMTYFKDSRGRTVMHMAAELGAMAACDVILKLRLDALHDTDKKVGLETTVHVLKYIHADSAVCT